LVSRIADSVVDIEHASKAIIAAHQRLDDIGKETCVHPKGRIAINEQEYWEAMHLYENTLIAESGTEASTSA
jgi:hypothetical protein